MPWFGQFVQIYIGQRAGTAERRITAMSGAYVVCPGDLVTQNFSKFEIDLRPIKARVADTVDAARAITAQTKPAGF
jgi:hypothetical protein